MYTLGVLGEDPWETAPDWSLERKMGRDTGEVDGETMEYGAPKTSLGHTAHC